MNELTKDVARRQRMEGEGWRLFEACCGFEVWAHDERHQLIFYNVELGSKIISPDTARALTLALAPATLFAEQGRYEEAAMPREEGYAGSD